MTRAVLQSIPILAALLFLTALPGFATTVTNINDSGVDSLRGAIDATPPGGTIDFDIAVNGLTITLTTGQLFIDKDLTIDASALPAGITIDAAGNSRVIEIASGGHTITFDSLTITGGNAFYGAGLIIGNATLAIANSTLAGNTAVFGGAIFNQGGTLTIDNSTLSGNVATGGVGGGLVNEAGPANFNNSTISGNSAGFSGGGGGIGIGAGTTVTLNNTIVAGNLGKGVPHDIVNQGTIASTGVNLIGTNDTVEAEFPFDGILVGNNAAPVNPLLAPLAHYGGPTRTMRPLVGSPAIEGSLSTSLLTDQRGNSRPNGPLPDIGAVEAGPFFLGPPLADTDNDGIPDILEGPGGPYPHLAVGTDDHDVDSDGDGSTDAQEIANMTDLFDIRDSLRIVSFTRAPGFSPSNPVYEITWATFPGLSYSLECETGLGFGGGALLGPFTASGFTHTATILLDNGGRDFVRARRD